MMNLGSEMFEGHHHDRFSVEDFITYMSAGSGSSVCQEFGLPNKMHPELRVFGYSSTSKFSASAGSLVEKILLLIQSIYNFYGGSSLLQLWTPIRCSSGGVMLTVSEQPFAIQKLCKGLCRYRYSCMRQDINVEGALVGPIGKVFTQGYPACGGSASSSLSNCHFAKKPYGIGNDWRYFAFPLFECDNADNGQLQQCAGVLEISSYYYVGEKYFWHFASLKGSGIECIRSDFQECFEARCGAIESKIDWTILNDLSEELQSPLTQIWLPCMCDTTSRPTHEFLCTRNPLVGRAYSENKACYIRDTSLSISDYPLVNFTFSDHPSACFVVQLKSIHPVLHPLVLEVFLPRLQNCDHGNFPAQLNSLLSTVTRKLSKRNAAFGLQENEDFLVSNCHSDDDNVMYFEIHRSNKSMATDAVIGHGTKDSGIHDAFINRVITSSREFLRSCDDVITMDGILIREEDKDTGEDVQMIEEMHVNLQKQPFPPTTLEANDCSKSMPEDTPQTSRDVFPNAEAEIDMDAIPSGEKVEASAGKLVRSHKMLGSSIQETAGNSKEIFTIDGDEITLDIINPYRGRAKLDDVAKDLKVSRATLKRRLRKLGIRRWPHCKRNEVHNIQSRQCSDNNDAAVSISIPATENGKSVTPGNHKIDQGHLLIVKAIFRDEIAKFPFPSNSGIADLHSELHKRFELEVGRFKIKYKDEDEDGDTEWINLSCNEDLIFRIETLTASKKSTMILSVFPFAL